MHIHRVIGTVAKSANETGVELHVLILHPLHEPQSMAPTSSLLEQIPKNA